MPKVSKSLLGKPGGLAGRRTWARFSATYFQVDDCDDDERAVTHG